MQDISVVEVAVERGAGTTCSPCYLVHAYRGYAVADEEFGGRLRIFSAANDVRVSLSQPMEEL